MSKLKLWNSSSWDESEAIWDEQANKDAVDHPLKTLKHLPKLPGMTPDTAINLKWKSLKYMLLHDKDFSILKNFLKHPFKYTLKFIQSAIQKKPFKRIDDFFLYGIKSLDEFESLIKADNILVVGFSYCHKPLECPSGRFNDQCIHQLDSPICRQCFIGKAMHALPDKECIPLIIPTIHYIGNKIFEIVHSNPNKKVVFLITACEMTLEMFGDWGNMVGIHGIGVRLDGRICNTMKAFELSEKGIKPGLTVVLDETKKKLLHFIKMRREKN